MSKIESPVKLSSSSRSIKSDDHSIISKNFHGSEKNNEANFVKNNSITQVTIPLGLNRYFLITIACIFCILNGPVVLNWVPIRSQLTKSGVYSWLCDELYDEFDDDYTCGEQRKAIALLSTLSSTLMFVGAVFGGFVSDTWGPKTATTLGSTMFGLHYLMLGVSTQSFQLYIPAYIINGLAIEMCFFGLISIANLFPSNQSFALSVMGTFRSISMAYGILQNAITVPNKFNLRGTSFLCMSIALGLAVLAFFTLPNKNFILIKSKNITSPNDINKDHHSNNSVLNNDIEIGHINNNDYDDAHVHDDDLKKKHHDHHHGHGGNDHTHGEIEKTPSHIVDRLTGHHVKTEGVVNEPENDDLVSHHSSNSSRTKDASTANIDIEVLIDQKVIEKAENKAIFREAWYKARRPVYLAFILYFCLAYSRGSFYSMSVPDVTPDVTDAFAILSPLSFIPCPFLGYLADTIGMLWVLLGLNTVAFIMYICLASGQSAASQWITVFGSMILFSFLASQNYCYITGAYSERIAGKLAGVAMLCAGLFAFVNTPLYNWATDDDAFSSVFYIYLGVSVLLYGLLGFMWYKKDTTRAAVPSSRESFVH